jgi:hypothetical protein
MGAVGHPVPAENYLHVELDPDNPRVEDSGDFLVQFTFDKLLGFLGFVRCEAAQLVVERNIFAFGSAAIFTIER